MRLSMFLIGIFVLAVLSVCGCCPTYPDPQITYDHTDAEGRVYIPVTNWAVYPNEIFQSAPDLPPCGANANSSRTWVDVYNADNDQRIYGFCAFGQNEDLKSIWFLPAAPNGKVYVVINDRKCNKKYRSNTIAYGECAAAHPEPQLAYDHTDSQGRVYLVVTNRADYPNEMFRQAPELPPCGANTSSSRTWVDIYNADGDAVIYGFCSLGSSDGLKDIWFMPGTPTGNVYVVLNDRACGKKYRSNTISYGN